MTAFKKNLSGLIIIWANLRERFSVGAAFLPRPSRLESRSHKNVEVAETTIKRDLSSRNTLSHFG